MLELYVASYSGRSPPLELKGTFGPEGGTSGKGSTIDWCFRTRRGMCRACRRGFGLTGAAFPCQRFRSEPPVSERH